MAGIYCGRLGTSWVIRSRLSSLPIWHVISCHKQRGFFIHASTTLELKVSGFAVFKCIESQDCICLAWSGFFASAYACVFARWLRMRCSWNIEEYLPRIDKPVLVIQGNEDNFGTPLQIQMISARCSGPVETVLLPKCGHTPHRDQPQLTFDSIVKFIRARLFLW